MKNIIIILLILILPITIYAILSNNAQNNSALAKNSNLATLKIYSSTMCLDCQKLKKEIKDIEVDYQNKINIEKFNALENNKMVQEDINKYEITLVPTMIFITKDGETRKKIEGYIPKEEIIKEIESTINE